MGRRDRPIDPKPDPTGVWRSHEFYAALPVQVNRTYRLAYLEGKRIYERNSSMDSSGNGGYRSRWVRRGNEGKQPRRPIMILPTHE
jgi:hypothetical protein